MLPRVSAHSRPAACFHRHCNVDLERRPSERVLELRGNPLEDKSTFLEYAVYGTFKRRPADVGRCDTHWVSAEYLYQQEMEDEVVDAALVQFETELADARAAKRRAVMERREREEAEAPEADV